MSTTASPPSMNPGTPTPEEVQARGQLWGHPKGLFLLFSVEMWERFSYYGMRGLLVLYLIAVIAASQLKPGVYTNTLQFSEAGATPATVEVPCELAVSTPSFKPSAAAPVITGSPKLIIQKMKATGKDPQDKDKWVWAPEPEKSIPGVAITTEEGKKPELPEAHYLVSNPTDAPIKLTVGIKREKDAAGKEPTTYFTANDSSGVVTADIPPTKGNAKPYEVKVAVNVKDSGRNWAKPDATNTQGWYAGLCYLLPLIGGLIADKLIGTHKSMVVGGLLIALGHIALAVSGLGNMGREAIGMDIFIGGLALIVIGTGHFKPSVSVMVGQLYSPTDPRRDAAFSIFYMGINLGAFLCNYVCGTLGETVGWHWGFGAAAVGMLVGLGMYIYMRPEYLAGIGMPPDGKGASAPYFIGTGLFLAALTAVAFHYGMLKQIDTLISNQIVSGVLAAGALLWCIYFTVSQQPEDRGPVATIFIFTLFNAVFWLAFEQASTSINVFTDERTNRNFFGMELQTPWFQSINPFLIFIGAPIFGAIWTKLARKGQNPSQPMKIFLGLFFLGIGYLFMTWAGLQAAGPAGKAAWSLVAITYFWHTVGELCLSPTGLSYVTKAAPKSSMSLLMGVYLMASFIANLGGGKIAGMVEDIEAGKTQLWWSKLLAGQASYFFLFVFMSMIAAFVILVLTPWLKTLMRNKDD